MPPSFDRTKCPICGAGFLMGLGMAHYRSLHPEYARWASRWLKIFYILLGVFLIGSYVIYNTAHYLTENALFSQTFFGTSLTAFTILLLVRFRTERAFRKSWSQAGC